MSKTIARCLFKAKKVDSHHDGGSEQITLRAEYDNDNPRDQSFSQCTPSGELVCYVTNPNVVGQIEEGKQYYITITPADEDDAG